MGPSDLKILAMSGRGSYVLVQVKDIFKVLPSKQCPEGEMPSRGTFSSQAHKQRLMDAAYQDISPCLVLTPNKTAIKLIIYNLRNRGTQWLTYKSFRDVLEMKEEPDVDKFKKLLKKLPTGVDSGRIPTSNSMDGWDAEVGVSRPSNIKSGSPNSIISMSHFNVRAFENLFIKYYEFKNYYEFPQKPTPEQLDCFSKSFPLKRFIELEKSELEFLSNTSPIKIRYEKWLEIHARALHALLSLFSKHNAADVRNANDHLLKLWKFLPLNPSSITSMKSQTIHATWMMKETTRDERRGIDQFLNALVQKSNLLSNELPLCGGKAQWYCHGTLVDIGAYQLLFKRHLLGTPLRLWPLICNAAARPMDYEASFLAKNAESTWKDGSRVVVKCEGNGGYEVSRLWSSMVECEIQDWCIETCALSCEYEFRMYYGFSPPARLDRFFT
jgi:hypothetical protein